MWGKAFERIVEKVTVAFIMVRGIGVSWSGCRAQSQTAGRHGAVAAAAW